MYLAIADSPNLVGDYDLRLAAIWYGRQSVSPGAGLTEIGSCEKACCRLAIVNFVT